MIAGSTWGPDEDLLIRLINDNPSVKFIVAPHEMDESRINRLLAETLGGAVRYTQCTAETSFDGKQLLVLDTVGILSSAYGYAEWGYIGGGFGVGIHNTLEAATFGLPIAFGPNYEKFKEARDLVTLGAATPIHSYEELKTWFTPCATTSICFSNAAASPKTTRRPTKGDEHRPAYRFRKTGIGSSFRPVVPHPFPDNTGFGIRPVPHIFRSNG